MSKPWWSSTKRHGTFASKTQIPIAECPTEDGTVLYCHVSLSVRSSQDCPPMGPGGEGSSGCTRWEAFWISRITALESALSGQETTMKPTNFRLHSRASRLSSRACGWTQQCSHDLSLPLPHFPSSDNTLGGERSEKAPSLQEGHWRVRR